MLSKYSKASNLYKKDKQDYLCNKHLEINSNIISFKHAVKEKINCTWINIKQYDSSNLYDIKSNYRSLLAMDNSIGVTSETWLDNPCRASDISVYDASMLLNEFSFVYNFLWTLDG